MLPTKGVDISSHNGTVDFVALKKSVDFAIIRCGYGSDYQSQDDSRYLENVKNCEAAGMPYGVYLYSYAKNVEMAKSEAQHTIRLLKGTNPSYGVWYDVEDETLPQDSTIIDNCIAYCSAIENAGYYCGIYASLYFWNSRLNSSRLNPYDKWVAHWADSIGYDGEYGIWQYSDNGYIGGKTFDMNLAYKDYPSITRKGDDTDMTKDEVARLAREEAQKVYDANEIKYPTISSVPSWARAEVQKVYDELALSGAVASDGNKKIDASYTYVRALYVISKLLDTLEKSAKTLKANETKALTESDKPSASD